MIPFTRILALILASAFCTSCMTASTPEPSPIAPRLFMAGDSTMASKDKRERPETGWGEKLPDYFRPELKIFNHAMNGRSSKSFRDEGRWQEILDQLRPGDYVFVQFGHNDQKINDPARFTNPYTGYRDNLKRFVEDTRARGATPVLLSSIVRRNFNDAGSLIDTHAPYPAVMRDLAREMKVYFIDLNTLSERLVLKHGVEGSLALYMHLPPRVNPNYPDGVADNTHLKPLGASEVARLVADTLCTSQHALSAYLNDCR